MQFQNVDSHKHLSLLFHNSLYWHSHILILHQHAMQHINRLRYISNLVLRFPPLTIYHSLILPIFDNSRVVYDTCSQSDTFLSDTAKTTAEK